jgi:hypothetical protein
MVREVREVAPRNAFRPIEVTLFGIVNEVSEVAPEKAPLIKFPSAIVVRPVPKFIDVKDVAFWKALFPIEVTVFGIVNDVNDVTP